MGDTHNLLCGGKVELAHDSVFRGHRISTFVVTVPQHTWVHLLTHRAFSRNAQSLRASSTRKLIQEVLTNPYVPVHWTEETKGMYPRDRVQDASGAAGVAAWLTLRDRAVEAAETMTGNGVHKEITNRVLAPFLFVRGIITATEWENFFRLRTHETTQADTQETAVVMQMMLASNKPVERTFHLPFLLDEEMLLPEAAMVSAARCARVSYYGNKHSSVEKEIELAERLLAAGHLSPFEHQAWSCVGRSANFIGWVSHRHRVEQDL